MFKWILIVLCVLALAAGGWWLARRSPYTGHWVNVSEATDTLQIARSSSGFEVTPAAGAPLQMILDGDRLRPAQAGSTLELIHDAATDQLHYPIFSDTERLYRRTD